MSVSVFMTFSEIKNLKIVKINQSMSVSGQLHTYPSLNPSSSSKLISANVELGEGWVCNCPDTNIDPNCLLVQCVW